MSAPMTYEQVAEHMRDWCDCADEVQENFRRQGRHEMADRCAVIYEAIAKHCVKLFAEAWP